MLLCATVVMMLASCSSGHKKAKYVFYFIGDGMGFSHISLAEGYLATKEGKIGNDPLCFTQFPVMGMATSYSASNYITCSSAAGTALPNRLSRQSTTVKQIHCFFIVFFLPDFNTLTV